MGKIVGILVINPRETFNLWKQINPFYSTNIQNWLGIVSNNREGVKAIKFDCESIMYYSVVTILFKPRHPLYRFSVPSDLYANFSIQ